MPGGQRLTLAGHGFIGRLAEGFIRRINLGVLALVGDARIDYHCCLLDAAGCERIEPWNMLLRSGPVLRGCGGRAGLGAQNSHVQS